MHFHKVPVCSNMEGTGGMLVSEQHGSSQCLHGVADVVDWGLSWGRVNCQEGSEDDSAYNFCSLPMYLK